MQRRKLNRGEKAFLKQFKHHKDDEKVIVGHNIPYYDLARLAGFAFSGAIKAVISTPANIQHDKLTASERMLKKLNLHQPSLKLSLTRIEYIPKSAESLMIPKPILERAKSLGDLHNLARGQAQSLCRILATEAGNAKGAYSSRFRSGEKGIFEIFKGASIDWVSGHIPHEDRPNLNQNPAALKDRIQSTRIHDTMIIGPGLMWKSSDHIKTHGQLGVFVTNLSR